MWMKSEKMYDQYGREYEQLALDVDKLSKYSFKRIEAEIFQWFESIDEIRRIKADILLGSKPVDSNGGGRSNLPGDPVGSAAQKLADNVYIQSREEIVEAIREVYQAQPPDKRKLFHVRYWSHERKKWHKIADELHVDRSTAIRWRDRIVQDIAKKLNWR